ncbi:MAG: translation initiation factor IF-2 N-terminal domain-containing protein, partial [Candidatus Cloacimonadaceae bacterium]|nr:translation initiation factor IF-2 N-terminal domain-containing protein [Candidatus Cloacimonadaceae bacterium]
AKELKISTMALKKHLTDLGVITKSHMSLIDDDVADKIRFKYKEQIDAEKRAEKDRKRFVEMKQAAKNKPEVTETPVVHTEETPSTPAIKYREAKDQQKIADSEPVQTVETPQIIEAEEKPQQAAIETSEHTPQRDKKVGRTRCGSSE